MNGSDWNEIRTDNHSVFKQILNHLTKLAALATVLNFRYELSGCEFESYCSHITPIVFRRCAFLGDIANLLNLFLNASKSLKTSSKNVLSNQ